MISKFPGHIKDRWSKQVLTKRTLGHRETSLSDILSSLLRKRQGLPVITFSPFIEYYLHKTDKSVKKGIEHFMSKREKFESQKENGEIFDMW